MYDGNFSAELFKPKAPKDVILLANGAGFMVGQDQYHSHLKVATEIKEVGIIFIFVADGFMIDAETDLSWIWGSQ